MFRSTANSTQRLYQSVSQSATRSTPLTTGRFSVLPCASTVDPSRFRPSPSYLSAVPHLSVRSLHHLQRPPTSQIFSFNLLPLYNTLPTQLPSHRIGIRFMNSDSKKPPTEGTTDKKDVIATETSAESSSPSSPSIAAAVSKARENPALKGLVDSVDTRIQRVRSNVNPRDLLYYSAILGTFVLLVVGPVAARYVF
jgi:hypothetical protein